MKKILVTGGAGFIGSNLAKTLLERNNKVIIVDNFSQGSLKNLSPIKNSKNLKVIKADVLNSQEMTKASKGVDIIFHLAVQCLRVSLQDPLLVDRVNSSGTLVTLWSAHKNGVKKFIYCSSSEVYGSAAYCPMDEKHPLTPTTVYGTSKLSGELYTQCFNNNFKLKTVIVRPFNTYGYNEHSEGLYGEVIPRFVVLAKNNLPLSIFGNGSQTRDFTFVTDTVEGLIKASENEKVEGQAINIAKGEEVSIKKIAQIITKLTGSKSKIKYMPARPHDVKKHFSDNSKAKKILSFEPKIGIEQGIGLYINNLEKTKFDFKKALNNLPEKNW